MDGAGDVDGDGRGDVLVGASQFDAFRGKALLYSGADGRELASWLGNDPGDAFGYSVSGAGDWDSDGVQHLFVGAFRDDDGGTFSGTARIVSGATSAVLVELIGDDANDQLGKGVGALGDANGDGVDDVIVGAWMDDDSALDAGSARAYAGPLPAFTDLGFALPGSAGAPSLSGAGTLLPGTPLELALTDGLPSGSATLVAGFATVFLPFKGGTLVPQPTALVVGLPLDGAGSFALSATWPAGVPAGTTLALQVWIPDTGGPVGFAASNAVPRSTP